MKITKDKLLMTVVLLLTSCGYLALLGGGWKQAENAFLLAWFAMSQTKGFVTFAQ